MSGTAILPPAYTPATFLMMFPEFGNAPSQLIQVWLNVAIGTLSIRRWGSLYELGIYLFTAHNLALGAEAARAAGRGAAPGGNTGLVSSKSAASLSISFDTGSTTIQDGGAWNLTHYGTRLIWMAKLVGTGGVEVSPAGEAAMAQASEYNGPAWAGPITSVMGPGG